MMVADFKEGRQAAEGVIHLLAGYFGKDLDGLEKSLEILKAVVGAIENVIEDKE